MYIIIKETKKKKVMGRGARDNLHLKHKQRCQQFNILQHEQQQTTYYQKKKKLWSSLERIYQATLMLSHLPFLLLFHG